jgi:hypothetical protein
MDEILVLKHAGGGTSAAGPHPSKRGVQPFGIAKLMIDDPLEQVLS